MSSIDEGEGVEDASFRASSGDEVESSVSASPLIGSSEGGVALDGVEGSVDSTARADSSEDVSEVSSVSAARAAVVPPIVTSKQKKTRVVVRFGMQRNTVFISIA